MNILTLSPHDIVLIRHSDTPRAERAWHDWTEQLVVQLRARFPAWKGFVLVMNVDESFETLSEEQARKLHAQLTVQLALADAAAANRIAHPPIIPQYEGPET